jgi:hypothetical protein
MSPSQLQLLDRDLVSGRPDDFTPSDNALTRGISSVQCKSLGGALSAIFPTQQQDERLHQAKILLGGDLAQTSDQDLLTHLTKLQYLIDSWMDDFESEVFGGKTLRRLTRGE